VIIVDSGLLFWATLYILQVNILLRYINEHSVVWIWLCAQNAAERAFI